MEIKQSNMTADNFYKYAVAKKIIQSNCLDVSKFLSMYNMIGLYDES